MKTIFFFLLFCDLLPFIILQFTIPLFGCIIILGCEAIKMLYEKQFAAVAELADAHGSGPCESNFMGVQVPSAAPIKDC